MSYRWAILCHIGGHGMSYRWAILCNICGHGMSYRWAILWHIGEQWYVIKVYISKR